VLYQLRQAGQVMFRLSPEVHRSAAVAAELAGKSLNQWAEDVLARAAASQRAPEAPV
jgi:predicted HicB family RNase H-like nuclease